VVGDGALSFWIYPISDIFEAFRRLAMGHVHIYHLAAMPCYSYHDYILAFLYAEESTRIYDAIVVKQRILFYYHAIISDYVTLPGAYNKPIYSTQHGTLQSESWPGSAQLETFCLVHIFNTKYYTI
jgi:hypothetical protein